MKNDCYIPGHANRDEKDLARTAQVSASSQMPGGEARQVINGVSRSVGENLNCWISGPLTMPQSILLRLEQQSPIREVRLTFDTDLSHEIQPSLIRNVRDRQVKGLPAELVKSYQVELLRKGEVVASRRIEENGQRLNILIFNEVLCDAVKITVSETYGCDHARIFEIRLY